MNKQPGIGTREPMRKSTANSRRTRVENEMLSVKMRQTKFGYDAEKPINDDAKKTLVEATQLLENVLVQSSKSTLTPETLETKLREVLEKPQELSKEIGKDDTELRDFATRTDWTQQCNCNRAQDLRRQHSSSHELLRRSRMKRLPEVVWRSCAQRCNRPSTTMF